ncbi:hypothetical protein F5Y04DRAFT_262705 [Hypomontagnella monticulosa]|nr:hypothetical protein F5Y04DRAFT_262705 [Hypomontagnella monticulosa]
MAPLSSYLFFLPFLGVSALSLTPRADCSADVTWSVTGLKLIDAATPNLITLKADRRRTLEFLVSSPTLPEPLQCIGDTGTYRSDTVRQFNTWTYNCWEGDSITPDATLAFQFESAFADEAKSHPAKVQLKQRCGSG